MFHQKICLNLSLKLVTPFGIDVLVLHFGVLCCVLSNIYLLISSSFIYIADYELELSVCGSYKEGCNYYLTSP